MVGSCLLGRTRNHYRRPGIMRTIDISIFDFRILEVDQIPSEKISFQFLDFLFVEQPVLWGTLPHAYYCSLKVAHVWSGRQGCLPFRRKWYTDLPDGQCARHIRACTTPPYGFILAVVVVVVVVVELVVVVTELGADRMTPPQLNNASRSTIGVYVVKILGITVL